MKVTECKASNILQDHSPSSQWSNSTKTLKMKVLWSTETSQTKRSMSHIQEELNQQDHCKNLKSHDPVLNIILIYANLNNYIFQNNEKLIRVHYNIIHLILAVTNEWWDFPSQNKTLSPSALKMLWGESICNLIQYW